MSVFEIAKTEFKIVVPVRNAVTYVENCIKSIARQQYSGKWECLIIDDNSTDGTNHKIQHVLDEMPSEDIRKKFKFIENKTRVGALKNFIDGFNILGAKENPQAVLVQIDGDDQLFGKNVFEIIDSAYQYGIWMTWGNYVESASGRVGKTGSWHSGVHHTGNYRDYEWIMSHLRTFKSHLWYSIKDEDLRDSNGNYFNSTWDLALMFPMVEMARERSSGIDRILYIYNTENSLSDHRIYRTEQLTNEAYIRKMQRYNRK